jgi:NADH-quinone oxidoreductase subunit F
VLVAIGQQLDPRHICDDVSVDTRSGGFIIADAVTGQTTAKWIFAGGDAVSGPSSVVEAVAAGERAAVGIDKYLTGKENAFWRELKEVDTFFDPNAGPSLEAREQLPLMPVDRRRNNFDEVEQPWRESVAVRQAQRCLRCDYGRRANGACELSHSAGSQ